MPHITVDYSESLADALDRRGFALALHPLVARLADARVGACKTRFRRQDEVVVADGTGEQAVVHVEVSLLSGRSPEVKLALAQAVTALVRERTAAVPGLTVHTSVDVRDLDAAAYQTVVDATEPGYAAEPLFAAEPALADRAV